MKVGRGRRSGRAVGRGRDALEGKGPQRQFDRRLEEVAKAVGGGYCWLHMPLRLALAVREAVAALEEGGGVTQGVTPPLLMHCTTS